MTICAKFVQIAGEAGAGKTQICLQLLLQVHLRQPLLVSPVRLDPVYGVVERRALRWSRAEHGTAAV